MSPDERAISPDQRFATDLEVADAAATPARSADSLVVHGMLSMIAPDEPARLEARIERAIAAVHAESERTSPIARIGPSARGLGAAHALRSQHSAWRRRIALAGGGIGIAAVLGFAVLFTPSGQSQSGSQAYAALDSIRAATARTEDRTFRVRIEHTGMRDKIVAGGPARDGMRDITREGELVLGSGGRYTLTWRGAGSDRGAGQERGAGQDRGAGRGLSLTTGFSGSEYWVVLPDGTVRTSDHPANLKIPPLFGTEPARQGEDDDTEQLTLDSMLARLERGYEIAFADRAPEAGAAGAPMIEVTATRRTGAGRRDRDRMPPPFAGAPGDRPGPGGDRLGPGGGRPGAGERLGPDGERPERRGPGERLGPDGERSERRGPGERAGPDGERSERRGPGPGGDRSGPRPDRPDRPDRAGQGSPDRADRPDRPGGPPGPGGPGPGPDTIRVLADASTFDVERLEARWTSGMTRTMVIERVTSPDSPASRPAEWFTPAAHVRGR